MTWNVTYIIHHHCFIPINRPFRVQYESLWYTQKDSMEDLWLKQLFPYKQLQKQRLTSHRWRVCKVANSTSVSPEGDAPQQAWTAGTQRKVAHRGKQRHFLLDEYFYRNYEYLLRVTADHYSGLSIQRTAWDNSICPLYGSVLNMESIIRIPYKH